MGASKVDIYKSQRQFEQITLSDQNVVKWLIMYRDKVDIYYGANTDNFYNNAGNVKELNQALINIYADLDKLIEKCNLTEEQRALIHLLSIGYTFKDIEETSENVTAQNAKRRFDSICKSLTKENDRVWNLWIHSEYIKNNWKECPKCGETLPANTTFFSPHSKGKYRVRNICKTCR